MKTTVHVSDTAYAALIQQAYDFGYVRGAGPNDKPRGLSIFVTMLSNLEYADARPEHLLGTGQWHSGLEYLKERCLHLAPSVIANIGRLALDHSIFPYKTQAAVVNGFRREATIPVLFPAGQAPPGRTSVKALVGPVLEAIGLGYLRPVEPLARAPADLYQGPSRREAVRRRRRQRDLEDRLVF